MSVFETDDVPFFLTLTDRMNMLFWRPKIWKITFLFGARGKGEFLEEGNKPLIEDLRPAGRSLRVLSPEPAT